MAHSSFYRFLELAHPSGLADELRALARRLSPAFGGSILLAREGINGAIAGSLSDLSAFESALCAPGLLSASFSGMVFKRSWADKPPFGRLAVHVRPELVAWGRELPAGGGNESAGVPTLSPAEWRAVLAEERTLLLDNRNRFEHRQGHFRGAAEPPVGNFRELAEWVENEAPQWRAEGRRVAMYCTGGIRCEKAAPWMATLGLDLVQLDGGILNFLQTLPDAQKDWVGDCVVFDRRLSLNPQLRETGISPEAVYRADEPDEAWRLARAQRLGRSA